MIQNLLNKPESYRKKVVFITTFIIGVLIFSIWFMIASYNVKQVMLPTPEEMEEITARYQKSLPAIRQKKSVRTELSKQAENRENNQSQPATIAKEEEDNTKEEDDSNNTVTTTNETENAEGDNVKEKSEKINKEIKRSFFGKVFR